MAVQDPQTDRELLLHIYQGLYGDKNGNPGFFSETRKRFESIETYIREDCAWEKTRADTCPYGPVIAEIRKIIGLKKNPAERREWIRLWIPIAVAATPGVLALVVRIVNGG